MLRYTSIVVAAALGLAATFTDPAQAQTPAPKPLVLKGQSTHPASANFHLIFKLWAETVEKMSGGRLKIETLPAGAQSRLMAALVLPATSSINCRAFGSQATPSFTGSLAGPTDIALTAQSSRP